MKMIRTIGAFLFAANALSANTEISSVDELNDSFDDVTSQKIGFLSRGNYGSIQGVLPAEVDNGGKLVVEIYSDLQHLEDAVLDGSVIAGLTTYQVDPKGKFNVFGVGRISTQSAFFKPGNDGEAMKQAFDAALVRVINSGDHKVIRDKYLVNGWKLLEVDTCSTNEAVFPFPALAGLSASDVLKGVIDSGVLRVGGFKSNWGFQGNYKTTTPSGFWPEFEAAIYQKIIDAYPLSGGNKLTVQHVWGASSLGIMDKVLAGDADMTAPYWLVPSTHNNTTPRHYKMAAGCTTIGSEQQFFTIANKKSSVSLEDETDVPPGVIAGAAISGVVAVMAIMLICIMIKKEKKGQPLFTPLLVEPMEPAENRLL